MHTNTKYWSFTWDTNVSQKKLPSELLLINYLNQVAECGVFQLEKGDAKSKEHYQGTFTLIGPRQSKTSLLGSFKQRFKNVGGLTISPVYDKVAINAYVTKEQGRVRGPFYVGVNEMYNSNMAQIKLRTWQKELFEILCGPMQESLKDRKVIWIQDSSGNTGKSWFQKWLRVAQKELVIRALPVSSVDRLISAVNIVSKKEKVDAYTIDLTRTKGKDQNYEDLFSAIEQIKNGYVIDVMYGKYNEAIFQPPMIIIFTNEKLEDFERYLSKDRWAAFSLGPRGEELSEMIPDSYGTFRYTPVKHFKEKYFKA